MKRMSFGQTCLTLIILLAVSAVGLTGCGLLPEEEEFRASPVFTEEETEEFKYVTVKRGDIFSTTDVMVEYEPAAEETYSFQMNNIPYGTVYVELGDTVKKDDLLAELDMESIEEDLYHCNLELIAVNAEREYLEKMMAVAAKRYVLNGTSKETADENAKNEYSLELERNTLSRQMLEEVKTELEEQRESRRIYSKIDGVVSFLRSVEDDDRSRRGEDFITVIDATMTFTAETEKWPDFFVGDEVSVEAKGKKLRGTVTAIIDNSYARNMTVQIVLDTSNAENKQGDRATAVVTTGERYQVLYLPKRAVIQAGGNQVVYIEENGVKRIKTVTTGFIGDEYIEIMSGLQENDIVVLP